jgi:hypothetical protein
VRFQQSYWLTILPKQPLNSGRSKGGYSPLFRVAFELFGAILYANCMQIMKKAPTSSDVSA